MEIITLGGGCFWCLEAVFLRVQGIISVESGYCNGQSAQPTYEAVCTGRTGCVEVVRIAFDPQIISLAQVLEIFFVIHDPTTLNAQGNDVGTQYRSGIYWSDKAHQAIAQALVDQVQASLPTSKRVVTELQALANYWPAEAYHQNYFANHPEQGYCAYVVAPKVQKFINTFREKVKP